MITEGINSLKEVANFKALVRKRETAITEPKLKDYSLLRDILSIVKDECLNLNIQDYKPYYVAIVAYLYSPRVYMGEAFNYGVRPELAKTLGITGQGITYYMVNVRNWITIYKSFSDNVEYLCNKVIERL